MRRPASGHDESETHKTGLIGGHLWHDGTVAPIGGEQSAMCRHGPVSDVDTTAIQTDNDDHVLGRR